MFIYNRKLIKINTFILNSICFMYYTNIVFEYRILFLVKFKNCSKLKIIFYLANISIIVNNR